MEMSELLSRGVQEEIKRLREVKNANMDLLYETAKSLSSCAF